MFTHAHAQTDARTRVHARARKHLRDGDEIERYRTFIYSVTTPDGLRASNPDTQVLSKKRTSDKRPKSIDNQPNVQPYISNISM